VAGSTRTNCGAFGPNHGIRGALNPSGEAVWFLDFPTLFLIIAAGFQTGLQAIFGVDAVGMIFGGNGKFVLALMGLSAVWQLFRQKFF
jgi:uncharacterized membrane protein YuzA (DUF378 family)